MIRESDSNHYNGLRALSNLLSAASSSVYEFLLQASQARTWVQIPSPTPNFLHLFFHLPEAVLFITATLRRFPSGSERFRRDRALA